MDCPTSAYWWAVVACVVLENAALLWLLFAIWPRLWNLERTLRTWLYGQGQARPDVTAGTTLVMTDREIALRERALRAASSGRVDVMAARPKSPSPSLRG